MPSGFTAADPSSTASTYSLSLMPARSNSSRLRLSSSSAVSCSAEVLSLPTSSRAVTVIRALVNSHKAAVGSRELHWCWPWIHTIQSCASPVGRDRRQSRPRVHPLMRLLRQRLACPYTTRLRSGGGLALAVGATM